MYVKGIYLGVTEDLTEIFKLRNEIFSSDKPHFDSYYDINTDLYADNLAIHALVIDEDKYVGCGSLYYDGEHFVLDNVGVVGEKRRQKIGDFLVRMLIDKAFQMGPNNVYVYCSKDIACFFETIGFNFVSDKDDMCKLVIDEKYVCRECHKMK